MFQWEISKIFKAAISLNTFQQLLLKKRKFNLRSTRIGRHLNSCLRALFFHVRTCLRAYVPMSIYIFFSCLRAFVSYDSCLHVLSTYLVSSINYSLPKCAHFSWSYVPTITQDLKTDIYPADEN